MTTKTKKQLVDFGERTSATFIQAFIGYALIFGHDRRTLEAAGIAGAAAAAKFVYAKAAAYTKSGSNVTAPKAAADAPKE